MGPIPIKKNNRCILMPLFLASLLRSTVARCVSALRQDLAENQERNVLTKHLMVAASCCGSLSPPVGLRAIKPAGRRWKHKHLDLNIYPWCLKSRSAYQEPVLNEPNRGSRTSNKSNERYRVSMAAILELIEAHSGDKCGKIYPL